MSSKWERVLSAAPLGLPLLVLMAILTQHFAWLDLHTAVETWDDDAGLFRLAMCLQEGAVGSGEPCAVGAPYPPLVPWVTSLFFKGAGGADLRIALFSLWPFLLLFCGALYIGMRRAVSPMAGLAAMALGPVVIWSLHIRGKYYTEVPLAALGLAAVVALAASDNFRNRLASLTFGLFLGLGLLTKWSFAFFLGPVAAVAIAMLLGRTFQSIKWGVLSAVVSILVPLVVLAGAAGWVQYGLTIGFWTALSLVAVLALLLRFRPQIFVSNSGSRMLNAGLCVAICVLISGPWYWTYLPTMQEFLAANMAQKFHGDPVSGLVGWPFYPAVLFTRMMSTPLLVFALLGGVVSFRKDCPSVVRWSLLGLISGTLILGVLPYRSGRYLVAGLGLLVPIIIWAMAFWPTVRRVALTSALVLGLAHQISWIPMAVGGSSVPHHWSVFTLPEPDLMGNTRHGIYAAYQDLLRPRWRFLPVANPPIHGRALSEWVARTVRRYGGQVPSLTVVVDAGQRLNLNAMATHLASTLPLPTTKVIAADGGLSRQRLQVWAARAKRPRDQPATALGPAVPRQLFVVWVSPPSIPMSAKELAALKGQRFSPVAHTGRVSGFEPVQVSLWMANQP